MRTIIPFAFFFLISLSCFSQIAVVTVHFDFDKAEIIKSDLNLLNDFLAGNPSPLAVYLSGHTDSKGSNAYNLALSQKRVSAVAEYLKSRGIAGDIIKEIPYGESKLLFINDEDSQRSAQNRRVEITVENKAPAASTTQMVESSSWQEPSIKQVIEDTAVKKGSKILFKNLLFEGGRHVLLPSSIPQMEELLAALQSNPSLKIMIEGHVCCIEYAGDGLDFDTNKYDLSYQRAKAVYDYLVRKGIDSKRLKYKGFGHSVPVFPYPEQNFQEQTANRRVEIEILEK